MRPVRAEVEAVTGPRGATANSKTLKENLRSNRSGRSSPAPLRNPLPPNVERSPQGDACPRCPGILSPIPNPHRREEPTEPPAESPHPTASPQRAASGPPADAEPGLDRIATVPNLISLTRILLIPVFVSLLLHHGTEAVGLLLLGGVVATDWVDGYVARHTGQVSTLGKVLDPVADRLALAAALVSLVVRDAFPLWAALVVLVRDGLILIAGAFLLVRMKVRLDVRWIGKVATFALMFGIPLIAWGRFRLLFHEVALPVGWVAFVIGAILYYGAGILYGIDIVRAIRARG